MLKRIREDSFQIYDFIKKYPFDFLRDYIMQRAQSVARKIIASNVE